MRTVVLVAPTAEPVSLADAKLHLRVDDDDQDSLIARGIASARESIESAVRRALMPQTLRTDWPGFPDACDRIFLPRAPVVSVTEIAYTDPDGLDQVLDPATYRVLPGGDGPAEITPTIGNSWPATAAYPDAVRVTYSAGYADAASVPACAVSAILLRLGTLYESRESLVTGTIATPLSDLERWLIAPLDWGGYP